ncbi:MAG: peptide-methionine (S)-S-oxide reductase MsrA [Candidatus Methylophosphatis roskildensis]
MNDSTANRETATEVATLGSGCFWCIEGVYSRMRGVIAAESGYSGGHTANPTYRQICGGDTGHAEVVRITFDPAVVSYRDVLEVFFTVHDPTTPNRQGNDVGTQYRSVIFHHSPQQLAIAQALIAELEADKVFPAPIVTALLPATTFYMAEDYHQLYYSSNADQPYCQYVVAPKLEKFRRKFAELAKE